MWSEPQSETRDEPVQQPQQRTAPVGVLFVHGMGSSTAGSTLRDFGEPLVEWLMNGDAGMKSVTLTMNEEIPGEGVPAHAECRMVRAGCRGRLVGPRRR